MADELCNGPATPWGTGCYDGKIVDAPICYQVGDGPILNGIKRITLNADCTAQSTEILDQALAPVPGAVEVGCLSPTEECCDPDSICSLLAQFPVQAAIPGDPVVYVGATGCYLSPPGGAATIACPYEAPCDGSCAAPAYSFASDPDSGVWLGAIGDGPTSVNLSFANCASWVAVSATDVYVQGASSITLNAGSAEVTIQGATEVGIFADTGDFRIGTGGQWALSADPGASGQYLTSQGPGVQPVWTTPGMTDVCTAIEAFDPVTPATGPMRIPVFVPGDNLCATVTVQDVCDFCATPIAFPLLAPDGDCTAPSYSFTTDSTSGMFFEPGTPTVVIGFANCTSTVEVGPTILLSAANGDSFEVGASINANTGLTITLTAGADINLDPSGAVQLSGVDGVLGQVFTSQGVSTPPIWTTPAAVPSPATTVTTSDAAAGIVGVLASYAREDHKHSVSTGVPVTIGTANSAGVAITLARSDHVHDHGSQPLGAGTNHAVATGAVAGFMSATDKTRFDALLPATTVSTSNAAAGVVGVAVTYAREDHKHSITTATPVDTGTANAAGVAVTLARSDHVHRTLVAIQSAGVAVASRPTINFISGTGITVSPVDNGGSDRVDVTVALSGGATVLQRFVFQADQFDSPVTADWAVNSLAPAAAGTINSALTQRRFDDTVEEGVGGMFTIPAGSTSVTFRFKSRAQTAPAGARTVGLKLYSRVVPDNAVVGAWGSIVLTNIDIPTNTNWQYDSQTITLATLGWTAGNFRQFELTRVAPTAGTNLTGDWNLIEMIAEFT